jgi:hypothetical protein
MVGAITRDGSSSININIVSIFRTCVYGGLTSESVAVDVLLYFSRYQKCLLSERKRLGSYSIIGWWIVGWRHPLGKNRRHEVGLVRSQPAMSIRSTDREEWTLTTPGCGGYTEPEWWLGVG